MSDIDTLFAEDLSKIDTSMPLLAACREDFTVGPVEQQSDDKGERLQITLNSTKDLAPLGGGKPIGTTFPHRAAIFLTGDNVKESLAAWVQCLGIPSPRNLDEFKTAIVGQTGKFNVTIKGEFNRFRPVAPNGK